MQQPHTPAAPAVPGYEILQPLGSGGMAQVFLARQRNLERLVAIKFLTPRPGTCPQEQLLRFDREARLMAQAAHPNVVTVFDRGAAAGQDYLVMEYVEGSSLRGLLELGGPLAVPQARRVLREVAAALTYLHERGVVHRDVKPENVLIDRCGTVRVTDFGISFSVGEGGAITRTGQALGSHDYAAPEQRARLPVDARADQFSLAVLAYEVLAGRRPLGAIKPPSRLNRELGPQVDPVLLRALRQDPDERYPTVQAFAEALDRALVQPPARSRPSKAAVLTASALALTVGMGGAVAGLYHLDYLGIPNRAPEPPKQSNAQPPDETKPDEQKAAPDLKRLVQMADEHAARERFPEAVAVFDEAISLAPDDPSLPSRQGDVYLKMGNRPAAIAAYSKAIKLEPKNARYWRQRGWAHYVNSEHEQAEKDLKQAVALEPGCVEAHTNLGAVYFQLRQYPQALAALNQALELNDQAGYAYYLRGVVHEALAQGSEARADFRESVRVGPHLAAPHRALAFLLIDPRFPDLRNQEVALEHAWKAFDLTKGADWHVLKALGCVYAAGGDWRAAVRWCRKAQELAPAEERPALRKLLDDYAQRAAPAGDQP